ADGWSDGHRGHRTVRGPHRPAGRRIRAVRAQIVKTSSVGSREDQKMFGKPKTIPTKADALPGRTERMPVPPAHFVNQHRLAPPLPEDLERAMFGMGCFWGAERKFWELPGVYSTAVGYAGGVTPNPTYREVCTGMTGHTEAVLVVFDPKQVSYDDLLRVFWENHDPTQGMRQGNDVGTQYRSAIYAYGDAQQRAAERSRDPYHHQLAAPPYRPI